jgi:hypothetical protein
MNKLDGHIGDYISSPAYTLKSREDKLEMTLDILRQTENLLNIVKNRKNLFTHTDLKCENLFYKLKQDGRPEVYLADFDKSSITMNNIRFHCKNKTVDPYSFITQQIIGDQVIQQSAKDRIEGIFYAKGDEEFILNYRLGRNLRNVQDFVKSVIEFEELYMRYNFTPYYMSFDIITLVMSMILFNSCEFQNAITEKNQLLFSFMNNYFVEFENFARYYIPSSGRALDAGGNFGEMIGLLYRTGGNEISDVLFKQKYNPKSLAQYDYLKIDKLYLTENCKIGLSIPFKPLSINLLGSQKTSGITIFNVDSKASTGLYTGSTYREHATNIIQTYDKNHLTIEYNKDYAVTGVAQLLQFTFPVSIIKTNRYSYTTTKYNVYDYDDIKTKDDQDSCFYTLIHARNDVDKVFNDSYLTKLRLRLDLFNTNDNINFQSAKEVERVTTTELNKSMLSNALGLENNEDNVQVLPAQLAPPVQPVQPALPAQLAPPVQPVQTENMSNNNNNRNNLFASAVQHPPQ